MKRRYWRFARPVGSAVCLALLLCLAWFLRLILGAPALKPEAQLRKTERKLLCPAGELVELLETRYNYATAVTRRNGELYVYSLMPVDDSGTKPWSHLYQSGHLYQDTAHGQTWGCCTFPTLTHEFPGPEGTGTAVSLQRFHALVKAEDPRICSGRLTVVSRRGDEEMTWHSEAERTNPYYLAFPITLRNGSDDARKHFYALQNGQKDVTAEAEAVFYDENGDEVSRLRFTMGDMGSEGSESNGT